MGNLDFTGVVKEYVKINDNPNVNWISAFDRGRIIHLKHIMFPDNNNENKYYHCGECKIFLPFNLKEAIYIFKKIRDDYPSKLKDKMRINEHFHPDVSSKGILSLGNATDLIYELRKNGELDNIATMINGLLHSYNEKDWYIPINMFYSTTKKEGEELYTSLYKDYKGPNSSLLTLTWPDKEIQNKGEKK